MTACIQKFLFETETTKPVVKDNDDFVGQAPTVELLLTTLNNLKQIRDSQKRGSKDRHIFGMACNRLNELMKRMAA